MENATFTPRLTRVRVGAGLVPARRPWQAQQGDHKGRPYTGGGKVFLVYPLNEHTIAGL